MSGRLSGASGVGSGLAKVVRKSNIPKVKLAIDELGKFKLTAGWLESAKYDAQTPVAGIAATQEFGSPRNGIPPRPFIRPAISDNRQAWIDLVENLSKEILAGNQTARGAMSILGLVVEGNIKEAIIAVNQPELSPITIALRKFRNENPNAQFGRGFVHQVGGAIAAGETGPGQLGDQSFGNTKPLNDSGIMLATVTHRVE